MLCMKCSEELFGVKILHDAGLFSLSNCLNQVMSLCFFLFKKVKRSLQHFVRGAKPAALHLRIDKTVEIK